jgi:Na+/H+ antiporter NhaC
MDGKMTEIGAWCMLPALLVLFLAIRTKKPLEALLAGCVSSYAVIAVCTHQNFKDILLESFFKTATDHDHVWMILVCGLFGSVIALLNYSKGTTAIARFLHRFCKTEKSFLMFAWLLGILIFVDDYMNAMTISSCMKKLGDRLKVPRSALAYVIDSTSAPTCVLVPFSTWAIFYAQCFYEQPSVESLGYGSAMGTMVRSIPYMFYAVIALLIVPLFILRIIPPIGPMKREYEMLENRGAEVKDTTELMKEGHIVDFVLPIGLIILVTIIEDMFVALIISILSCALLYVPRRIIKPGEFCELWLKGFADMIPALALLLAAFFMKQACDDIGLPQYVVNSCLPFIKAGSFPAVAFIVVSILAFITGDSWGVPAVCVPIILPLAAACNADILLTMGAVVSGGVFCSHACFYADTTVLTSTYCDISAMLHAKTQLPYAAIAFVISFILFAIFGYII